MSEDNTNTSAPQPSSDAAVESAPAAPVRPKRRIFRGLFRFCTRFVLLVGVPVLAALIGLHYYVKGGRFVDTENAYVKANIVAISADRDGRVTEVLVQDNELIKAGRVLFHLDSEPAILDVRKADAQLDVVRTEIEGYRADYLESLAQSEESKERVRFLEVQYKRQRLLREKKLGKREDFDAAAHDLQMSKRRVSLLQVHSQQALAKLTGDPDITVEQHPRYLEAIAIRDQVNVQLKRTTVVAQSSGVISNMKLQVGEYVEEGKPIFSLIESAPIWVEANLKETQLSNIVEGMTATIEVDAYPGIQWNAKVNRIAPATGAEFALLPPQNATGNWVKVVQRIPVHLKIEHKLDAPPLRAGMTAAVSIDTEVERELPAVARELLEGESSPGFLRAIVRQALAVTDTTQSVPSK